MGLLDNLLGDDGKSERSLVLKSKPMKDGVQNLYDTKGKPLKDSQTADYGSGREPRVGVPAVSVPAMRPFGFLTEGPTDLDAAIQARNMATGAYAPKAQLPGFLSGALDVLSSPLQWLMQSGAGAMMPQGQPSGSYVDPELGRAAEQARRELLQQRIMQERINNQ